MDTGDTTIDLSSVDQPVDDQVGQHDAIHDLNLELIRFQRVIHALKARIAHQGPPGVEAGALGMLAFLANHGDMRQGDLAAGVGLDPSTVSRHVRQLVASGLVERQPHPEDGRAVHLAVTEAGHAAFAQMRERRLHLMREILADWPTTDVETLSRLIGRLVDDVGSGRTGPPGPALDLR